MARTVNFDGVTLRIPGAYSSISTNQVGALPLSETGIVGIIGEANKGGPGNVDGILEYDSTTLSDLINYYGDGQIVDAARALVNASNDTRVRNGANRILVFKTNQSTKASSDVLQGISTWASLSDSNYGVEGNLINYKIEEDTAETFEIEFGADWSAQPANDLKLRINGGTEITLDDTAMSSAANTVTEINSKINTYLGTVAVLYATLSGARITLNLLASGSTAHRHGMGVSLEFVADTEYGDIGVTSGQRGIAIVAGSSATSLTAENETRSFTINRQSDGRTETSANTIGEVGGRIYLSIGCKAATSCDLTITATQFLTNATGIGAGDLTLSLSDYTTLNDLADFINTQTGYTCTVPSGTNGALPPTVLDRVSGVGICSTATAIKVGQVKADSYEVNKFFAQNSSLVTMVEVLHLGLPDVISKTFLSGGARGATATSDVNDAFVAFETKRINSVIPLFSQDASDDLAEDANYTDPSSSYDVESIHTLTVNHCKLMSDTQNRNERDNYIGYRGTFQECKEHALAINSEFASIWIQDAQVINRQGELEYKQPHIHACLIAGMQAGSEIGLPMTHKYMAANGIKHVKKQGVTPSELEIFNADKIGHQNQAIDAGISISESPSSGGIRLVVGNTTYSKDGNFVFNRKSVLQAANYVAFDLRTFLENLFIGNKAITGTAESIRNAAIARFKVYLDGNIIVGDDTNGNLGWKNLAVKLVGSVAYLDVTITPVQGVEFILNRIVLDDIRQSA